MIIEVPYIPGESRFYSDKGVKIQNKKTGEISDEIITDEKLDPADFVELDTAVDTDTPIEE